MLSSSKLNPDFCAVRLAGSTGVYLCLITRVRDNLKCDLREGLLRKPSLKSQKQKHC